MQRDGSSDLCRPPDGFPSKVRPLQEPLNSIHANSFAFGADAVSVMDESMVHPALRGSEMEEGCSRSLHDGRTPHDGRDIDGVATERNSRADPTRASIRFDVKGDRRARGPFRMSHDPETTDSSSQGNNTAPPPSSPNDDRVKSSARTLRKTRSKTVAATPCTPWADSTLSYAARVGVSKSAGGGAVRAIAAMFDNAERKSLSIASVASAARSQADPNLYAVLSQYNSKPSPSKASRLARSSSTAWTDSQSRLATPDCATKPSRPGRTGHDSFADLARSSVSTVSISPFQVGQGSSHGPDEGERPTRRRDGMCRLRVEYRGADAAKPSLSRTGLAKTGRIASQSGQAGPDDPACRATSRDSSHQLRQTADEPARHPIYAARLLRRGQQPGQARADRQGRRHSCTCRSARSSVSSTPGRRSALSCAPRSAHGKTQQPTRAC